MSAASDLTAQPPPSNPVFAYPERAFRAFWHKPARGLTGYVRLAIGAAVGLTMGTLLDSLHVWNQAASYRNVWKLPFLDVAWYVPLEFMVAGAVGVTVRPELDEGLDRVQTDLALNQVLWSLAGLTAAWWGSGYLTNAGVANSAISSVLTLFALGMWAIFDSTRQGAIAAAITAVIGVVVESLIVKTGTYVYKDPDLLGLVPQWLPSLYITACVAVGNLGRYMKYSWHPAAELESVPGPAPRKAA